MRIGVPGRAAAPAGTVMRMRPGVCSGVRPAMRTGAMTIRPADELALATSQATLTSQQEIAAFIALKRAFDPHFLLNPDKAIPTLNRCAELGRMRVSGGALKFAHLPRF